MGFEQYLRRDGSRKRMGKSLGIALLLHALAFAVGSVSLATQAEYGMAGAVASPAARPPQPLEEQAVDLEEEAEEPVPVKKEKPKPAPAEIPAPAAVPAAPVASAPTGGALEVAGYYRNPPPPYPEECRRSRQEGLVMVHVEVDAQGKVSSARLGAGSGFPLLDDAAVRTVTGWQFKPARMAGLAVASQVDVPIRFRLKGGR